MTPLSALFRAAEKLRAPPEGYLNLIDKTATEQEHTRLTPLLELGAKAIEALESAQCWGLTLPPHIKDGKWYDGVDRCVRCSLLAEARKLLEKGGQG